MLYLKKISYYLLIFVLLFVLVAGPMPQSSLAYDCSDEKIMRQALKVCEVKSDIIYRLEKKGLKLSKEADEGITRLVQKANLDRVAREDLDLIYNKIEDVPATQGGGSEGLLKFFENIGNLGENTKGLEKLSKKMVESDTSNMIGIIGEVDVAAKKCKGKDVEFGNIYKSERFSGKADLDIVDSATGDCYEVKNLKIERWNDEEEMVKILDGEYEKALKKIEYAVKNDSKFHFSVRGNLDQQTFKKIKDRINDDWGKKLKKKGLDDWINRIVVENIT